MRRLVLLLLVLPLVSAPVRHRPPTEFSRLVERLSEGGGFFLSDNLVSNETSYLHVLGGLHQLGVSGGAYLGVGPEQNFSYIAAIHPTVALVVDIRRDNLLLHLLFKAMFTASRNRLEYLTLLYGRPTPSDLYLWTDLDLIALLEYIDETPFSITAHDQNHRLLMERVEAYGIPLSVEDRATIRRFHDEFATSGLDIRYTVAGRPLWLNLPTGRDLYLETDLKGELGSYLATEDRWRTVRDLQVRDRVIPVVGDLAGPKAVRAIGEYVRETKETVSAFYVSNIESYLFRQGTFSAFVENVRSLPFRRNSVVIRSWFGRGWQLPSSVPGHISTQILQTFPRFLELTARPDSLTYWDLVNDGLPLAP